MSSSATQGGHNKTEEVAIGPASNITISRIVSRGSFIHVRLSVLSLCVLAAVDNQPTAMALPCRSISTIIDAVKSTHTGRPSDESNSMHLSCICIRRSNVYMTVFFLSFLSAATVENA